MSIELYLPKIAAEENGLHAFFEHNIRALGISTDPAILSLQCALMNEEPVLRDMFGADSTIIGIEIDRHRVDMAQSLGRQSVTEGNIFDEEMYPKDTKFDLVIGRNIITYMRELESVETWTKFLRDLLPKLVKQRSSMLLTFCNDYEFAYIWRILKYLKYRIIKACQNSDRIPCDQIGVAGMFKDSYFILAEFPASSGTCA